MSALISAAGACHSDQPASAAGMPPPPAVRVTPVVLRDVSPTDELTGRVEAIHDVAIRARVAGYVTAVKYREGTDVAAGATLFQIDARPYQAVLARANAELARAQARIELARTEAERAERLFATGAITRAERDVNSSTAAQAVAEVAGARATVDLARLDVEFTQVRAPMAGRTSRAAVSIGDYVTAASPLTSVASIDPVYVYFTGDEQAFLRFGAHALGTPITVALGDEQGFPHQGTIDFVDNRVDAATGTIRLRAVLPNADHRLTPGLYARVRLAEAAAAPAVLVDDKAILTDQDRKYVYVLGAGDTVERRDVKLGRIVDGLRLVTEGLKAGDRVITSNIQKIGPGSKATVAPEPVKTAGVTP